MTSSRDPAARKLIDRLVPDPNDGQLLGLLTTSYELDPEFFETDFLPSALGLGSWSDRQWASRIELERHLAQMSAAAVLLDARRYRRRPRSFRVETIPVALPRGRALHAKVTLLVHESAVRLLVGSANATEQGYRKNREVAVALHASERSPSHAPLLRAAIATMPTLFGSWWTAGAGRITDDALRLLESWSGNPSADESWFAWSGGRQRPLWMQFVERWPDGEAIERVTVVSPFWSKDAERGSVRKLLAALANKAPIAGARLRLLTEARPETARTWRPVLPEAYGRLRLDDLEVEATAEAVQPEAQDADVDNAAAKGGTRPLHAKVVLVEGRRTSLAYVGSGNFTNRGWGFLADVEGANIEAGIILRRVGRERAPLESLIPPTVGRPVALDGAATGKLALPEPEQPDGPWPAFVREVVLVPDPADTTRLQLAARIAPEEVAGAWSIALPGPDSSAMLLESDDGARGAEVHHVALTREALEALLEQQEVLVRWWDCADGRRFPVNVDAAARDGLPITPGAREPGENHLIAYYQGRIAWEDLFPDPDGCVTCENGTGGEHGHPGVDTSGIQAYQVREFVEALHGIMEDLGRSSSSPGAMRLALLGPVSPVALARQILEAAVNERKRTPVAAAFQLLEILRCLAVARGYEVSERYRPEWLELVAAAEREVSSFLQRLRAAHPRELAGSDGFRRYERTIRAFCRKQGATS